MKRFSVDQICCCQGFSTIRTLSRHDTFAQAVAAAPTGGQPKQTGTHEWLFPGSRPSILIHDNKMEGD